ncbi:MAG: MurR/RpiR family transcriptional regulator, partial [Coprobacillus cateniformis]
AYIKENKDLNICDANIVLMTQNVKYRNFENICADYVIQVPGKFDGIQFNYQIMLLFDILRIYYYQKYYI